MILHFLFLLLVVLITALLFVYGVALLYMNVYAHFVKQEPLNLMDVISGVLCILILPAVILSVFI